MTHKETRKIRFTYRVIDLDSALFNEVVYLKNVINGIHEVETVSGVVGFFSENELKFII